MKNKYLVPLRVLEKESLSQGIIDFLSNNEVLLLGYHVLPEQTPLDQARMQFEEKMTNKMEPIAESLRQKNTEVETRVVFTHDEEETIDRVIEEEEIDAVFIINPVMEIKDILVILTDKEELDELIFLLEAFEKTKGYKYTTVYLGEEESAEESLNEINKFLDQREHELTSIEPIYFTEDELFDEIEKYDLVVMGDVKKRLLDFFDKELPQKIADSSLGPVLVALRGKQK